ncbi:DPP IV N-terminal domain-containing protein [Allorhodopirellula heiligendammensis]|uniref:Translocation protein TolB n=1 Tax=Allorhodopirellula heiligendammensis TaxID=2714739 RepID=A0A5C6BIK7_9BACT|nr:DPP IV N-terminal domain-containing protein [Allorhodopirellula heiligendammensis]TWU11029.1 translocation protein TolB [Allorhodopirellula heiligendammensis]
MHRCVTVIAIVSLVLMLGCPSVENAGVEHNNVCIDLSPDGDTLVFASADGDLYLFDIAESIATRLTATDRIESYPSFSPDGTQIVFAATEDEMAPSRIYIRDLGDHSIIAVTEDNEQSDILPRFTPDGKRIVFARAYRHRPYSLGGWTWDMWDVCSIGTDGAGFARLTEEGYYQLYRIVPRADGDFVYAADRIGLENPAALYTVSPNNQPTQLIPKAGTNNTDVHAWVSDPMVGPDGKTLTFCSDFTKPFWYDVCIKMGDAKSQGLVGSKSRYNRYPDFFPSGERIVFLAGTEFNAGNRAIYSLWEVSLSGQTKELATSDLFTNPTNWLAPKRAEPSDATESR